MKYLVLFLIACGQVPAKELPKNDVFFGSCFEPNNDVCLELTGVMPNPNVLNKSSTTFICEKVYNGIYSSDKCPSVDVVGSCVLPIEDNVKYEYYFHNYLWTKESAEEVCGKVAGTFGE